MRTVFDQGLQRWGPFLTRACKDEERVQYAALVGRKAGA